MGRVGVGGGRCLFEGELVRSGLIAMGEGRFARIEPSLLLGFPLGGDIFVRQVTFSCWVAENWAGCPFGSESGACIVDAPTKLSTAINTWGATVRHDEARPFFRQQKHFQNLQVFFFLPRTLVCARRYFSSTNLVSRCSLAALATCAGFSTAGSSSTYRPGAADKTNRRKTSQQRDVKAWPWTSNRRPKRICTHTTP